MLEKRVAITLHLAPAFLECVDVRKFAEDHWLLRRPTLPPLEPDPLCPPDVRKRVAHRAEAVAEVASERGVIEGPRRRCDAVVRPVVVFVERPDVVCGHSLAAWLLG